MKALNAWLALVPLVLLAGCVSLEEYEPQPGDAFVFDDAGGQFNQSNPDASVTQVTGVDRAAVRDQRVVVAGVAKDGRKLVGLKLAPGEHTLTVEACESGWMIYCGKAYLKLDAEAGHSYRVISEMSKEKGYVDFWIVDLASGDVVVKPLRASGLTLKG